MRRGRHTNRVESLSSQVIFFLRHTHMCACIHVPLAFTSSSSSVIFRSSGFLTEQFVKSLQKHSITSIHLTSSLQTFMLSLWKIHYSSFMPFIRQTHIQSESTFSLIKLQAKNEEYCSFYYYYAYSPNHNAYAPTLMFTKLLRNQQ